MGSFGKSDFNRKMLTDVQTGMAVPGKEEVAKGDNAEVHWDWAGLNPQ